MCSDLKKREELIDYVSEIRDLQCKILPGDQRCPLGIYDLIVKRQGIPFNCGS